MAFFDKKSATPVNPSFLSYSFPNTTLFNKDQWQKKQLTVTTSNYYYEIVYPSTNDSKLTYFDKGTPTGYSPTTMYIYGLLHNNINGITTDPESNIVGETVIEFTTSSSYNKLYLCILLKGSGDSSITTSTSSIDKTINMILSDPTKQDQFITSVDLKLDLDLPKAEKCFIYKDESNTIIVLTEPIKLSTSDVTQIISKLETSTDLFKISAPNNYEVVEKSEKLVDDNNNDDIYIDCKPTGPGIGEVSTYQIPINSNFSKDLQQMDFMKTSMNFFVFIIGLLVIYFTVPVTYKMLVVDKVNSTYTASDPDIRKIRIRSVDVFLSACFFSLISICLYYGFKTGGDFELVTNGLFLFVFYGLSLSLLQFSKLSAAFMTTEKKGSTIYDDEADKKKLFFRPDDIFVLLGLCIGYIFKYTDNGPFIPILVCELIAASVLLILRYVYNMDEKVFEKYCWQILGIAIPVGIASLMFLVAV